jgi:leucyl-tRNA synthetase
MDYGTGAVFGCPAHDQRDFDFAKKYHLEILQVVKPIDGSEEKITKAYTDDGYLINSEFLNKLTVSEAKNKVIKEIQKRRLEKRKYLLD